MTSEEIKRMQEALSSEMVGLAEETDHDTFVSILRVCASIERGPAKILLVEAARRLQAFAAPPKDMN